MSTPRLMENGLEPEAKAFYCRTLNILNESNVPYLVGGAFALAHHTGIERHTKDFDVFLRQKDCERALQALSAAGCATEITYPVWLGKAFCGEFFVDFIYGSGNGVAVVDEEWFDNAVEGEVLGMKVKLCPPEETIWSKAYVMERERYDGADIAHILRACAQTLDWKRLLRRFDKHWRVLFNYLILFGFIYPSERDRIPDWVMRDLIGRLTTEMESLPSEDRVCQGTLISRQQFLADIEQWGYGDGRLKPTGNLMMEEAEGLTEALKRELAEQQKK